MAEEQERHREGWQDLYTSARLVGRMRAQQRAPQQGILASAERCGTCLSRARGTRYLRLARAHGTGQVVALVESVRGRLPPQVQVQVQVQVQRQR